MQYLIHLPDGTQYGPVDRQTLDSWRAEGRLPDDTLVWPEGAPEWVEVTAVLAASERPASGSGLSRGAAPRPAAASVSTHAPSPHVSIAFDVAVVEPSAAAPRPVAVASGSLTASPPEPVVSVPARPATPGPSAAAPAAAASLPAAAPAAVTPGTSAPAPDDSPDTRPRQRAYAPRKAVAPARRIDPRLVRRLVLAAGALVLLLAVAVGVWTFAQPILARQLAVAAVKRHALPERRIEEAQTGLVAELPSGWFALRAENPLVTVPDARLRLAQPWIPGFATLHAVERPRRMDALDLYLDELLQQQRLPRRPTLRAEGRRDVQLGRSRGRMVATAWEDGSVPMRGATVAWADGYLVFSLEVWMREASAEDVTAQTEALCRGLTPAGRLDAKLSHEVERVALEVPELPAGPLRVLVAEHMSAGRGLEGVPTAALRVVHQGLSALGPADAAEMRALYQRVWAPVDDADRPRMGALLEEVRAGRDIPPLDAQLLRDTLKAGVLALTPEERARLQGLSAQAARAALSRP